MSAAPLVSIIVPSYNQGRFLRETLDSILAQDHRPIEILVMDGASTDDSVAILQEYAARHAELQFWSEPDKGPADAVNKGLARARGVYAGIQSSDDLYRPGAISAAVRAFDQRPGTGVVYADTEIIDEHGRLLLLAPSRLPYSQARLFSRSTVIHQSSAFFRPELARELGGWNGRYFCCDTDLWLRLSFVTGIRRVDGVWSAWRKHAGQRDREARKMWDSWGRMIDECEPLRRASWHLRLAASAGRRLVALDYSPSRKPGFRFMQAWLAVLTWPPSLAGIYSKSVLVPGLGRLLARHSSQATTAHG
ncbi:MAG TPA: glycosyltransferase family 2 protein [Nevskiaceae bacterium]|nr:glycosyltransferase family 2 protein [Nevskiaceae bacterium]